jgi:hypothetical protein
MYGMTPEITVGMPGDPRTRELPPPLADDPEAALLQAATVRVVIAAAPSVAANLRESESLANVNDRPSVDEVIQCST